MLTKFFYSLLYLSFAITGYAETSVWKISHGNNELYLAGTIHLLAEKDLPFPQAFDTAYENSAEVVLETDLKALFDPATQIQMMEQMSYRDGRMLPQVISESLYQELTTYLSARGLPSQMFIATKPSGVMMTLLGLELQRLGIGQSGPDLVYYQRAVQANKPVSGLESVADHIGFVARMGEGNEEAFLRQTLADLERTGEMMAEIVSYWKQGDEEALERSVLADMRDRFPQVYQSLVVTRNNHWLPQIEQMLIDSDTEMVLVGAAHLVGPDGLLHLFRSRGYRIEQM